MHCYNRMSPSEYRLDFVADVSSNTCSLDLQCLAGIGRVLIASFDHHAP